MIIVKRVKMMMTGERSIDWCQLNGEDEDDDMGDEQSEHLQGNARKKGLRDSGQPTTSKHTEQLLTRRVVHPLCQW